MLVETVNANNWVRHTEYFLHDSLARVLKGRQERWANCFSKFRIKYNSRGLVANRSQPNFEDTLERVWSNYEYDPLRRLISVERERNNALDATTATVTFAHHGLSSTRTDPAVAAGAQTTQTRYPWCGVAVVSDAHALSTEYRYNSLGQLICTINSTGSAVVAGDNKRGFCTSLDDPDTGVAMYEYSALGELLSQADAKGQETTYEYDLLSRPLERDNAAGDPAAGLTSWVWGTTIPDIGKPKTVTQQTGYQEAFTYEPVVRRRRQRITGVVLKL